MTKAPTEVSPGSTDRSASLGKADLSVEPGETSVGASVTATWQLEV